MNTITKTVAPDVKWCARFVDATGNKKTPKYTLTHMTGYYPEIETQRGRDGNISFYLMESRDSGSKDSAPELRLQGKNSLNLTGLKFLFVENGKLRGYAYGYPFDKKTYSKDNKPNPFYGCKDDAYLFILYQKDGEPRPSSIDMLVLENGKTLASTYCKSLMNGGYDDVLALLHKLIEK